MKIKVYSYVTPGYDNQVKDNRSYIDIPETIVSRYGKSRMVARMAKCLPHLFMDPNEYDACLWLDSNVCLKKGYDFKKLITEYFAGVEHCSLFSHTERKTINEEILAINRSGLDYPELTAKHKDKPGRLAWTGIIFRTFTPEVIEANNRWWGEISSKSSRDQLSFPYCFEGLVDYRENPDLKKLGSPCWTNNSKWGTTKHMKEQNF